MKEATDDQIKLDLFKNGVTEGIKEFIGVAFEKADILDLIANHEEFQPLQFYNPAAVFDSNVDAMQKGQILSMLTNVQTSVEKMAKTPASSNDPKLMARIEKALQAVDKKASEDQFKNLARKCEPLFSFHHHYSEKVKT